MRRSRPIARRPTARRSKHIARSFRRCCASARTRATLSSANCRPAPSAFPTTTTRRLSRRSSRPRKEKRMSEGWTDACAAEDVDEEDVIRFDSGGRTFAIYRTDDDRYYATDGLCTHEQVHLSGGLVMGKIIECPKHNGRFDFTTGQAKGAPVCVDLKTYPVKVEAGRVLIKID